MKKSRKILFIIIGILIFALIAGVITCYITYPKYSVTLYSEDNTVMYHLSGEKDFKAVTDNIISVDSHLYIKTAKSNGIVFLPDESIIVLEPDTEVRVDIDQTGAYIQQPKGAVFHDVMPQNGKNYYVVTPHRVNKVEGTDFLTYVWDPASNSYIQQAPGEASTWNSGSGTNVTEGRVGGRIEIRQEFNNNYNDSNVPEGPLMPVIGTVTIIIPGRRSPYDIVTGAVNTGAGWSHLDAGNNSANGSESGQTTTGTGSSTQANYATNRRD